ncbi:MAG TPA: VCBS repeat-containing protein [bacterium]|jgi:hypothetical protein
MSVACVIIATILLMNAGEVEQSISSHLDNPECEYQIEIIADDFDGDGTTEFAVMAEGPEINGCPSNGELLFLKETDGELNVVWKNTLLSPWKMTAGDVDGDGNKEIAFGVWKESRFDPVLAKRPFFYYWDGENIQRKWLGSRLSRRFEDFVLFDINSDGWDELIALEIGEGEGRFVTVYRWDSFGFEWLGETGEIAGIALIYTYEESLYAETDTQQYTIIFREEDNGIFEIVAEETR